MTKAIICDQWNKLLKILKSSKANPSLFEFVNVVFCKDKTVVMILNYNSS